MRGSIAHSVTYTEFLLLKTATRLHRIPDVVKDFATGCMRTYLILKDKAGRWNEDKGIQALLQELSKNGCCLPKTSSCSKESARTLLAHSFDKDALLRKRLPYERLDQLTVDILTGER